MYSQLFKYTFRGKDKCRKKAMYHRALYNMVCFFYLFIFAPDSFRAGCLANHACGFLPSFPALTEKPLKYEETVTSKIPPPVLKWCLQKAFIRHGLISRRFVTVRVGEGGGGQTSCRSGRSKGWDKSRTKGGSRLEFSSKRYSVRCTKSVVLYKETLCKLMLFLFPRGL